MYDVTKEKDETTPPSCCIDLPDSPSGFLKHFGVSARVRLSLSDTFPERQLSCSQKLTPSGISPTHSGYPPVNKFPYRDTFFRCGAIYPRKLLSKLPFSDMPGILMPFRTFSVP